MSYAGDRWTSDYTFNAIYAFAALSIPFASSAAHDPPLSMVGRPRQWVGPAVDDPVLLVQGFIDPDTGGARFLPFLQFPPGTADPRRIQESADAALRAGDSINPYRLLLADVTGDILVDIPIEAKKPIENEVTELNFVQFIPCPPQARLARLVQGETRLAERFGSPHAPDLTLGAVSLYPDLQSLELHWTASDPDGDPLLFTLQYSGDSGQTWHTLRVNSTLLSAFVDTSTLPGSRMARLRVMASDGFNTTHAMTPSFVLPTHPPVPIISGVSQGEVIPFGIPLELAGSAMDPEDGSDVDRLAWNLFAPATMTGNGSVFPLEDLPPGDYTVRLLARDSDRQSGEAFRQFSVAPLVIPDGAAPLMDGKCDAVYRQAAYVRIPRGDGSYAGARLVHANGNVYISFTGLQLPDALNPVRTIGLRVDVNGDATPLGAPGDVGFFVNHNGIPYQEVGTGDGMMVTQTPQLGFTAVISRGHSSWSAEFRIAESLLGGWNHLVGLMLDHDGPHWPPPATDNAPETWAETWLGATVPTPGNRAPVAVAGVPTYYSVAEPRRIVLDGSASYDMDGDSISFNWVQTGGASVIFTNTTIAQPVLTVTPELTNQVFTFQLVVSDLRLDSEPSETTVTILPAQSVGRLEKAQCFLVEDDVQIRFPGVPGESYILQGCTDFSDWINLQTNMADYFGAAEFIERDIGIFPARFYRTMQP
jgi:hypothetical protein